jgi:hypothetical protein
MATSEKQIRKPTKLWTTQDIKQLKQMTRSYAGMSQGASAVVTDDVRRLLGREATSFDQVAKDYAHFFTVDGPRATLAAYR